MPKGSSSIRLVEGQLLEDHNPSYLTLYFGHWSHLKEARLIDYIFGSYMSNSNSESESPFPLPPDDLTFFTDFAFVVVTAERIFRVEGTP